MKNAVVIFIIFFCAVAAAAQKKPAVKKPAPANKPLVSKAVPTPTPPDPAVEKARLDEALTFVAPTEKVSALKKFIADFPNSSEKPRAVEALVVAYAASGDQKLLSNEPDEGIVFFKLAAAETPKPVPTRLFTEVVSKFPANLYYRGQREAAIAITAVIEQKAEGNSAQLLVLASFYLGIENGDEAKRLAQAAAVVDPGSVAAYQILGVAHRLNFDLEESAKAYEKALELDPESSAAKRSLAEMKRALGRSDEAAALYREVLTKYPNDIPANTGLILSLFDGEKKAEAETELARSLELGPKNWNLLAGTAYWYAAHGQGEKAVELAQKAVDLEPRYIWSHIALARGFMGQNKPVDAERVLIKARQYGNFPTLEYEIASARLMSGFYREAVEELQKSFTIKNGIVQTNLGGRISQEEKTFTDLIADERRASIFEPFAAEDAETAAKLKLLLDLSQKLSTATPNEADVTAVADEFVKGGDKMKIHRQLYAAAALLQKQIAVTTAAGFVKTAIGNSDGGLEVAAPAAAVMANELYESRTLAFARNEMIVVPDVPRQTLSAILRGRIEELMGWALYQQNNYPEAIIRLRRAISVLPDKSAWWRSSVWRLGIALEADGKDKEALENYIRSYKIDKPDVGRYFTVENLYRKINGSTDGLEAQIGPNPLPVFAAKPIEPDVKAEETVAPKTVPSETKAETVEPKTDPATILETTSGSKNQAAEISKIETSKDRVAEAVIKPEPSPIQEMPKTEISNGAVTDTIKKQEPVRSNAAEAGSKTETDTKQITPVQKPEILENNKTVNQAAGPEINSEKKPKELFEPIIITIPNSSKPKKEPAADSAEPKTMPVDESISTGAARPRVIAGQEIRSDVPAVCSISTSQENISIVNGGGSVGILIGIDNEAVIKDVSATSSSPKDIEITPGPEIAGVSTYRFYIVKSISTAQGVYQVVFEAPCGKKEILVSVR